MMEEEVVRRRGWLTREQFLDYVGAVNLIPGPNSTELAIHIGHARAGWPGLVVAGACFITPAMLIISSVAWAYVTYGARPDASGLLYGIKPVIMAIVLVALWNLGRAAIKTRVLAVVAVAATIAAAAGLHELAVLGAAGALMGAGHLAFGRAGAAVIVSWCGGWTATAATGQIAVTSSPVTLAQLFGVFAKAGAVLFGSGYVLLAFLRADLVERLRWLTEAQLLDAIAIGQMMPGPVFTTATFIGYILAGPAGAAVATAGIFLPAFLFVAVSGPLVPRLRRSPLAGPVLDGVNVASLALMTVVSWHLGRAAVLDLWTVGFGVASLVALTRWRINSAWLIAAGAAAGWLVHA
jgi:chromate transporter